MHKLQKQILNINYYDETGAERFYGRALDLFYHELSPEMVRILDKHDSSDQLIRIKSLSLDLGVTYESELPNQWVDRFREAFESALHEKLDKLRNGLGAAGEAIVTFRTDELELLVHYLQKGFLPWTGGPSINISSLFDKLLETMPSEVDKRFRSETRSEKMIRRIVLQFDDRQIEKLVRVMQPSESTFIIQSSWQIRKARQQDQFVRSADREFRDAIWGFVLTYIMNDRGSYFDTREYLIYLLHGIARHFNISFERLIQEIYKSIHALKMEPVRFRLGILLEDIYQAEQKSAPGALVKDIHHRQITDFLVSGLTAKNKPASDKKFYSDLITVWMTAEPLGISYFLHKNGKRETLERLVTVLHPAGIKKLLKVVAPTDAPFIIRFNQDVMKQQDELRYVKTDLKQFRSDLWVILLEVILNSRGSVFNQKVFVLTSLEKLSVHYNLRPDFFLDHIFSLIDKQDQIIVSSALYTLFKEMSVELAVKKQRRSGKKETGTDRYFVYLYALMFEDKGLLSGDNFHLPFQAFENKKHIIRHLMSKEPGKLKSWANGKLNSGTLVAKFYEGLEEEDLEKMMGLLAGPAAVRIEMLMKLISLYGHVSSPTGRSISRLELHRMALVSYHSLKRGSSFESDWYSLMMKGSAGILGVPEIRLAEILLDQAEKIPFTLPSSLKEILRKKIKTGGTSATLRLENELTEEDGDISAGLEKSKKKRSEKRKKIPDTDEPLVARKRVGLQKELARTRTAGDLENWLQRKLGYAEEPDLGEIRVIMRVFYGSYRGKKEASDILSAGKLDSIISTIASKSQPFLHAYLQDFEMMLKLTGNVLGKAGIEWIRSRILYFWSTTSEFSEKRLTWFLLQAMSDRMRIPAQELKELLFGHALKVKTKLNSRLILELGSEETGKESNKQEIREMNNIKPEEQERPFTPFDDEEADGSDPVYISNAGLVLLGPFIPVLLERAGLMKDRAFMGDQAVSHALQLLQYCVTNEEKSPEHLLPLPKILCGIDPADPVRDDVALSRDDRELVKGLLENVISQWSILGGTSVEGLQQTFLARQGALRRKEDRWELDVEQAAFDVLLDRLPWTYGMIKYAWMPKTLYTLWR